MGKVTMHTVVGFLLLFVMQWGMADDLSGQETAVAVRLIEHGGGLHYGSKKLMQDSADFVWIMYDDQLQRFDGRRMETFLSGAGFYSMLCDTAGRVWATQRHKVWRYDADINRFRAVQTDDTINNKALYQTVTGQLKYLSADGSYVYDPATDRFSLDSGAIGEMGYQPTIDFERFSYAGHSLFVTVGDTLYRHRLIDGTVQGRVFSEFRKVTALTADRAVVSDWRNKSWLYDFESDLLRPLSLSTGDPFLTVYGALRHTDDSFYLATSRGLMVLDLRQATLRPLLLLNESRQVVVQRFNALFRTADGAIWMTTNAHLMRFHENEGTIRFNEALTDVRGFAADNEGRLWLATVHGLASWVPLTSRVRTILAEDGGSDWLNHPSIRGLVYDGTNLIVGQTNKGIWLFNPATGRFRRPSFDPTPRGDALRVRLERDFINEIRTLRNGNHVVSARDGAYVMDGSTYRVTELPFPGDTTNVKFAYESSHGHLYIGTLNGLYALDSAHRLRYMLDVGDQPLRVFTMLEDGNGFYLGTEHGVYRFTDEQNRGRIERVFPQLRDEWITNLFADSLGDIWGTTENRLFRIGKVDGRFSYYGRSENVKAKFFHPNGWFRAIDGTVYLGGLQGINYFHPPSMAKEILPLKPRIQSLTVVAADTVYSDFREPIFLRTRYHDLEIGFAVPYFGSNEVLRFRYRLHPSDSWHDVENQYQVALWDLPPGAYVFELSASANGVDWYPAVNTLHFTVVPPFWKTMWFMALCGVVLVGAGYRTFAGFSRKLKSEKIINAFATSLYGQSTVDDMFWDVARNCVQRLGFVDCVVYRRDSQRDVMVQTAACGHKNPYGRQISNCLELPFGSGIVGHVAQTGVSERIVDTHRDRRYVLDMEKFRSEITVPVFVDGQLYAIIDSEHPDRGFYKRYHLRVLAAIASICGERISKFLSEENLRSKIARDLHDEMGSTLTSINITSKIAEQDLPTDHPARAQLSRIHRHTQVIMEKMSEMVWVVNPANDNLRKMMLRIREFAAELLEPVDIRLVFSGMADAELIKLNPEQRKNIYLILKEALCNAVKYSGATEILLCFQDANSRLVISIVDNGVWFNPATVKPGNGVANMHARAAEIGAQVAVDTAIGEGVQVHLTMDIGAEQHYIKKKYGERHC